MIRFFQRGNQIYAVETNVNFDNETIEKLSWLFGDADYLDQEEINGNFVGPRKEMITPWSTNAVEITQNMSISGITRIEAFEKDQKDFDTMLALEYAGLNQNIFTIDIRPESILEIEDIAAYNESEGLALNKEEIEYLEDLSNKIGRKLTDSEVFGFSQINSEHCRHKIFNGTFIIDGEEKESSLFQMIKKTSKENPNSIVSAYKDNVAFLKGPKITQFAPKSADKADFFEEKQVDSVISLKAETHNFPTTVEPFNGAATGSGGEIRDRLAGGKGSLPLAGTAVYMTSYSRLEENRPWEKGFEERKWLYQTPMDILIKASNGASDFGNKFGQPLITGSVLTFEHEEEARMLGFDKVIMQAGGIGFGHESEAIKGEPKAGDAIVIMGGDNYRIGMGGAAVSSADTGAMSNAIELNAIQRSNPEMQKRVSNAIRAMVEQGKNPIVSIHDHGAGGHLNCLSELVEDTGGKIDLDALPVGDKTLSAKEIIGNESQERMGLVIKEEDYGLLEKVAERERAPIYKVGTVSDDDQFTFSSEKGEKPMDLGMQDLFGSSPKTIMKDETLKQSYQDIATDDSKMESYLEDVLKLEAVACKDWLTNKVDRCVGGLVAKQQTTGSLQLPLNNVGVMALDYPGKSGIATAIGHAPIPSLIDEKEGAKMAITEALTNMIWAPYKQKLKSVSLSANWMWPCNNKGEDARLYNAVEAVSEYAVALGINIPTGKDSLSMKQKYPDKEVIAPGTVIISGAGEVSDINKVVEPNFLNKEDTAIYYINLSSNKSVLGGSSLAQTLNKIGTAVPGIASVEVVKSAFNTMQSLIEKEYIYAGHDVSSGGLITTLLEMCFANNAIAAELNLSEIDADSLTEVLFAENNGLVFQAKSEGITAAFEAAGVPCLKIGSVTSQDDLKITYKDQTLALNVSEARDTWYETSLLLDRKQTANGLADARFENFKNQELQFKFPESFNGKLPKIDAETKKPIAAVIREKGSNSERELANALYVAGFEVKDIHMTDLISGRENLEDVQFLGAVGGFSNSDVLGSAKGWAGAFKYNPKANQAIRNFFKREDTLSIGICNGCQLFMELDLIYPELDQHPKMLHNDSKKHESAFTSVEIGANNSVMLSSLEGSTLGVWISHGEGKFQMPGEASQYEIAATYAYDSYPSNPNGSDFNAAMVCSKDGRHLAMMPHIERSTYPWNWAYYPGQKDEISPWIQAFVNAKNWLTK